MGVRHRELLALRDKHGFLLVLDDAHATLVCDGHADSALQHSAHGRAGSLAAAAADISELCKRADVVVGTMSKAMGSQGGFVCCSSDMRCLAAPSLLPRPSLPPVSLLPRPSLPPASPAHPSAGASCAGWC